jgi:ribosomal protein S18 acetylase RimI-like enzyme
VVDETSQPPASGGSVEVRELTAPTRAEIEQLAELFDRYRIHYGEAADASRTAIASWLQGNTSSGPLKAFVAEDNGAFVGFAITMTVPASLQLGHFWQIRDLFVLPNHRRRGVGRMLLDFIRAAAIRAGALRLVLQTEADNTSALRLYAESGYTTVEGYCSLTLPLTPDFRGG